MKTEVKQEIKTEDGVPVKQEESEEVPPLSKIKPEPGTEDDVKIKLEDIPEKVKQEEPEIEIYTTNHYIGLQVVGGPKSLDLSREVNDWKAMCMSNEIYNGELMFLSIQHLKNTSLPDDVFEPGETRPQPPAKKNLKRPASEEPGKNQQPPTKRSVQGKPPAQTKPTSTPAAAAAG